MEVRSVACHMGSHGVTCYPTQVNTPRLNPSHSGRYWIYLPWRDGRLSLPSWLDSALAGNRTSDLSSTSLMPNHCATKTTRCGNKRIMSRSRTLPTLTLLPHSNKQHYVCSENSLCDTSLLSVIWCCWWQCGILSVKNLLRQPSKILPCGLNLITRINSSKVS